VRNVLRCFRQHEIGQDVIEYSLLLAFLCLSAGAVFLHAATGLESIWSSADSKLLMASNAASGKQASPDDAGGGGDKNKDGNPNDNDNGGGNDSNGNNGKGKGKK
jgi:Flp pilus assembly pilin Flp